MNCATVLLKTGMAKMGKVNPLKTNAGELYRKATSSDNISSVMVVESMNPIKILTKSQIARLN